MSPDDQITQPLFQFSAINVSRALYELVGNVPMAPDRPQRIPTDVMIGASAQISKDGTVAFVRIDTKVTPDQALQPYRIEVTLGGAFSSSNATQDDLMVFCKSAAPSILFPYIREIVHRMTIDAPNGVVRLDPINISAALNSTEWQVSEVSDGETNVSTAPPPPSSQSPSS